MIRLDDIVTNEFERTFTQSFYEHGVDISRTDILPGHYYSFDVPIPNFNDEMIPRSIEEWNENPGAYITNREYFDLSPTGLVFYHDNWKDTALILNLKVIPPKYRSAIILAHLNLIEKNLDRLGLFDKGINKLISIEERKKMNLPLFRVTPAMIEELTGFKLSHAMNGYKLDKIQRAKLLDWDNIGELPKAVIDTRGLALSPSIMDISSVFDNFENKQTR